MGVERSGGECISSPVRSSPRRTSRRSAAPRLAAAEAAQLRRRRHQPRATRQLPARLRAAVVLGFGQRRDPGPQLLADGGHLRLRKRVRQSHALRHIRDRCVPELDHAAERRRSVGASWLTGLTPGGDTVEATVTMQQNLPAGSGTGYYLSASSTEEAQANLSTRGEPARLASSTLGARRRTGGGRRYSGP